MNNFSKIKKFEIFQNIDILKSKHFLFLKQKESRQKPDTFWRRTNEWMDRDLCRALPGSIHQQKA
jgi:hypothetical protein